jgi:hypothetical protein
MAERITKYTEERHEYGCDDPGQPAPGVMQVFYENGDPVMVDFLCPCGCGNRAPTHLVPPGQTKKPNDRHWNYSSGPNGPTLDPSIRWTGGCLAHFTITDGQVKFH